MQWLILMGFQSVWALQQAKRMTTGSPSRLSTGSMLLADRGYDADWIRVFAAEQGAWANIPPRCNRNKPICFSPHLYRARNLIERFFNKIKQCRRIATRYDKLAQTTSPSFSLHRLGCGRALMSSCPS
jgi:transposase